MASSRLDLRADAAPDREDAAPFAITSIGDRWLVAGIALAGAGLLAALAPLGQRRGPEMGILGGICAAGVGLIASRRLRRQGHVWLSGLLLALVVETFATALESSGRYSYGWFFARAQRAIAFTALLMMLHGQFAAILGRIRSANRKLAAYDVGLGALTELQSELAAALPSRAAVIDIALAYAQRLTGATASALAMPDGADFIYAGAAGTLAPYVGTRLERAGSFSGRCADTGEALICRDTVTDPRVDRMACCKLDIASMIVVPIVISPVLTAVLKVASAQACAFGAADVRVLQLVANLLAGNLAAAHQFTALDDSERRYRELTDALPQLMGILDRSLELVFINKRCWHYTGQTVDEINDTSAAWIVHRDDQELLTAAGAAIAANADFTCELRLRRRDGTYLWHSLTAVALPHAAGVPQHWIFTASDIEDRKRAEGIIRESGAGLARVAESELAEASGLREANRLLTMAEEMAHVGHYRLDLGSNEVSWSDEVYRTYGLPVTFKPDLATAFAAYHPGDRDRVIEIVEGALADGRTFSFGARIVRADGTIRDVVVGGQAERTPAGKVVGLFGILQDVTSINDAEREREALSERVILATRAGKIGIWELNIGAGVLDWDGAMHALYGIDEPTTVPTYDLWLRIVHPDDRQRSVRELQLAITGDVPFDTEFRVIRPSGEVRHLRAMATLLRDSTGAGSGMVGATWDITEVRGLADNLRAEKERAEEANRAKSDFLARMSHEIRTPMNGIIGFTTLLLDAELSPQSRRYVELLGDAGRSLLGIINDILDFSKLEAGHIGLERIPLNLAALVEGAVAIVRGEALPKGIALDVELGADLPAWVSGDPTRVRQTLLNLLTNALKFTDLGSIRVVVRRAGTTQPDLIRFEIIDTGIGIAAEHRPLLFSDFSQLEISTTRRYGGTGLGLAICRRLVEAMGGAIGVESELGVGSRFWFTAELPEIAAPGQLAPHAAQQPIAPRRILVADDNRVNQIVVESLLRGDGHDVVLVENGAQAVDAVRAGHFDLVLMDMQMPVMDGVEAARAIRALPAPACDVAIVALTANAMAEQVERCHAAGMNAHLAKPIDRELLRSAIADWTRAARPLALPPLPPVHVPSPHAHVPPPTAHVPSPNAHGPTPHAHVPTPTEDTRMQPNPQFTDTATLGIATLLEIFDGDLASVGEILEAALASIEIDFVRIEQAAASRDMTTVVEAAHRMKGTSGSIRSQRILEISATIQQAAKTAPESIEPALLDTLGEAVREFRRDFAAYQSTNNAAQFSR